MLKALMPRPTVAASFFSQPHEGMSFFMHQADCPAPRSGVSSLLEHAAKETDMAAVPHSRPVYGRKDFERELVALRPNLRAFGYSLAKKTEEAEDLAQEAILKALKAWETFIPGSSLKAWTFMILQNLFYSEKRRSWRSTPLDQDLAENIPEESGIGMIPDRLLYRDELERALYLLMDLSIDWRDVIVATRYLQMPYEEAAWRFGVRIGTIKSRVSRGMSELVFRLTDRYRLLSMDGLLRNVEMVEPSDPRYPIRLALLEIQAVCRRRFVLHVPEQVVEVQGCKKTTAAS